MQTLIIEYRLEQGKRGYQFTSPTRGLNERVMREVWRCAMPRGKHWSDPAYAEARSLKCFTVDGDGVGVVAASEVEMTDQVDEMGRSGIRRATVYLMTFREQAAYLERRLASLPAEVVSRAERKLLSRDWELLLRKHRDASRAESLMKPQTIFAYDYSAEGWQFVEACLLLLVTRSTLLTNLIELTPKINPFADRLLSFTTLALEPNGEGRLVALPYDPALLRGFPFIDLR